jgi:PHD/YefM family antitoxin component YafN of YafNO toxin-antitoxin module
MVAYASHELIPSSEFAKRFGSYLSQIKGATVEKIAILKNNNIEAVLLSKDNYEEMKLLADSQRKQMYDEEISKRVDSYRNGTEQSVPFSDGLDAIREKILKKI